MIATSEYAFFVSSLHQNPNDHSYQRISTHTDLTFQLNSRKMAFQDRKAISKKDLDIIRMPEILTKVFTSTV